VECGGDEERASHAEEGEGEEGMGNGE